MAKNENEIKNKKIIDLFNELCKGTYKIPSFQRKWDWNYIKVVRLFDSILAGFPINSFLFQKINHNKMGERSTTFYKIPNKISENYKPEKISDFPENFYSVIDGQQRLTSFYIGLSKNGSIWDSAINKGNKINTKENRSLYFNLLKEGDTKNGYNRSDQRSTIYGLEFKKENEVTEINDNAEEEDEYWFKVADIIDYHTNKGFSERKFEKLINENEKLKNLKKDRAKILNINIRLLYEVIFEKENIINCYYIKETDEDEILDIFLRVNGGGKGLTFSDYMIGELATYDETKDCKDRISNCIDNVRKIITISNKYNDFRPTPFNITEENVLRTILVCTSGDNADDIKFSSYANGLDNRIKRIAEDFDNITKSIDLAYKTLNLIGFDGKIIPRNSFNIFLPFIYFIFLNIKEDGYEEFEKKFMKEIKDKNDSTLRDDITWYIVATILNSVFSTSNDGVIWNLCRICKVEYVKKTKSSNYVFSLTKIIQNVLNDKEVTNLSKESKEWIKGRYHKLDRKALTSVVENAKYNSKNTMILLMLLYPTQYKGVIDKDHLHPEMYFRRGKNNKSKELIEKGVSEETISLYDTILNLQPYYYSDNRSKNNKPLLEWYKENNKTPKDLLLDEVLGKYNIEEILEFKNFEMFIKLRKKAIIKILERKLSFK